MTPKRAAFFSLRHLLQKLDLDRQRMKGERLNGELHLDAYAAFDFFVTATSIPDWVRPGTWPPPTWDDDDNQIFHLCVVLGNHAKHPRSQDRPQRD